MVKAVLSRSLNKYLKFDPEEVDELLTFLKHQTFPKKAYLLSQDEICRHRYFILNGLLRAYYIDDKGKENILLFGIENWWLTDLESFVLEQPSRLFIQALEETTVLSISKDSLEKLYQLNPKFERLFRILTERLQIATQKKYTYYFHMSNKERYRIFVETLPDFAQRIPQYMIASYLEMTPEYLSELRKLE